MNRTKIDVLTVLTITMFSLAACSTQQSDTDSENETQGFQAPVQRLAEPRVRDVPREQLTEVHKNMMGVDANDPTLRERMALFRTLVKFPDMFAAMRGLGSRVSALPAMSDYDRELVIMRIAWLYQGEYEWGAHYDAAVRAGISEAQIEAIKAGAADSIWSDWERTLISAADQLVMHAHLDDATWSSLRGQYSEEDILGLLGMVTHYHMIAMVTNTFGIQLDEHMSQGF